MKLNCRLDWTTTRPTLCPSCLEELNSANIVFHQNVAFCPLCCLFDNRGVADDCVRIFSSTLAPDHWAQYRRLLFFTPRRHPKKPLQLVRAGDADDWLLDPQPENHSPVTDDNPISGGSPV